MNDAFGDSKKSFIKGVGLKKIYKVGEQEVRAIDGVDIEIHEGEALAIVGSSGGGKSTLLHILGTLDSPTEGELTFNGENIFKKSEEELASFRNKKLGFVFQFHHLLNEFTAVENVMIPARIGGLSKEMAKSKASQILDEIGLGGRLNHLPSELSGGEQQRVAIARALIQSPDVLIADEPTGNLDTQNSKMIEDLFFQLHQERKLTLIVVTHDVAFARRFPRMLQIRDGKWVQ
jgi:lipoprotein-releasing system ATP-binding protein